MTTFSLLFKYSSHVSSQLVRKKVNFRWNWWTLWINIYYYIKQIKLILSKDHSAFRFSLINFLIKPLKIHLETNKTEEIKMIPTNNATKSTSRLKSCIVLRFRDSGNNSGSFPPLCSRKRMLFWRRPSAEKGWN